MKLMFCPKCSDIFKPVIYQRRSCRCGEVQGRLLNPKIGEINGKGTSMAIDNNSLIQARDKLLTLDQNQDFEYYIENTPVKCWVRPHVGPGNPRNKIENKNSMPIGDTVTLLREAVEHYKNESSNPLSIPAWMKKAEEVLKQIP